MSLTNAVLTKIENAEDIDMTKNIRLLRQIFGRTRRNISPLAFSVAVVEHLMYSEECATEDIKVMKDVYPTDGMSANELLEKLKSIQRGGESSEPET